jgi:hypothetical protein
MCDAKGRADRKFNCLLNSEARVMKAHSSWFVRLRTLLCGREQVPGEMLGNELREIAHVFSMSLQG